MGEVYDEFLKKDFGIEPCQFLPWVSKSYFLPVNMNRATRKSQLCCLFGFKVFLLLSSKFLKEIINVVNVIPCTCDHPRNGLK